MSGIDRSQRITFEEQADLYDAISRGYPAQLVDQIVALAGLPADGRILEIGCGSGQATVAFAERGYRIVAVELGERLAQLAREKLRAFPQVTVIRHEFESWPLPAQPFHLILSADAFHWIEPQVGIPKLAQALVPGGTVALVWRVVDDADTPLHRAIASVYAQVAPGWQNPLSGQISAEFVRAVIGESFAQVGGFEPLQAHTYVTHTSTSGADYIREQLRIFSAHRDMPDAVRQALYDGILAAFRAHDDCLTQTNIDLLLTTRPAPR